MDVNADKPDAPDIEMDEARPFYGRLEHILILHLLLTPNSQLPTPDSRIRTRFETATALVLTCISCCDLRRGVDARSRVAMFSEYLAQQYIHMGAIGAVVCLVQRERQLGIIDRSSESAKPVFMRDEEVDADLR